MIVQDSFLRKLRSAFDLNIYEVKIWTALLSRGISTAGELSDISNVPRSRSYDVLESLEKKGFIIMKLGKPIRYIAVQPEEVIRRLKRSIKTSANSKLSHLDKIKNETVFKDVEVLFKQGVDHIDPTTLAGSIKGRENIYDHLESLLLKAKKSVTIMTTQEGFIRKVQRLKDTLKKLANKKVKIRIAVPIDDQVKKSIKELGNIAQVRPINPTRGRFCIIDGKEVLMMLLDTKGNHESYDNAIWINTPFFSTALENMFNASWDAIKPVNVRRR